MICFRGTRRACSGISILNNSCFLVTHFLFLFLKLFFINFRCRCNGKGVFNSVGIFFGSFMAEFRGRYKFIKSIFLKLCKFENYSQKFEYKLKSKICLFLAKGLWVCFQKYFREKICFLTPGPPQRTRHDVLTRFQ